jgi:hypothetical protein
LEYNYTYLGIINVVDKLTPFNNNNTEIHIDDAICLIIDHDDGQVRDASANLYKLFGHVKIPPHEIIKENLIFISELIPDF